MGDLATTRDAHLTEEDAEFLLMMRRSLRSLAEFLIARCGDGAQLSRAAGEVLFFDLRECPEMPGRFVTVKQLFDECADDAWDWPVIYAVWAYATAQEVRRTLPGLPAIPRQALCAYANAQDDIMRVTAQQARDALEAWDRCSN